MFISFTNLALIQFFQYLIQFIKSWWRHLFQSERYHSHPVGLHDWLAPSSSLSLLLTTSFHLVSKFWPFGPMKIFDWPYPNHQIRSSSTTILRLITFFYFNYSHLSSYWYLFKILDFLILRFSLCFLYFLSVFVLSNYMLWYIVLKVKNFIQFNWSTTGILCWVCHRRSISSLKFLYHSWKCVTHATKNPN